MKAANKTEEHSPAVLSNAGLCIVSMCSEIIASRRVGGTRDRPLIAVHFCRKKAGHNGLHSGMHNVQVQASGAPNNNQEEAVSPASPATRG